MLTNSILLKKFENYNYFKQVEEYIKINYNNIENEFYLNFIKSENETFKKLLISIIREKLLDFLNLEDNDDDSTMILNLKSNQINSFQFKNRDGSKIQELSFKINQVFGFDFFTFEKPVYYKKSIDDENTKIEITDCLELIEILKENNNYNDLDQYKIEIVNSISNHALISTLSYEIINKINIKSKENNWKYLSDYVNYKFEKKKKKFDKFLFYDQIHLNGHHIHPCSKVRLGLNSVEQVIEYSYELKKVIPIRFIGLKKSVARYSIMNGELNPTDYFLNKLFPMVKEPISNYCLNNNIEINDYLIYPMIPFQIDETFPKLFKNEILNGELLIFPESIKISKSYQTSSLRNLIPVLDSDSNNNDNSNPPHIKFSVPIQTTNFYRYMINDFIPVGTCTSMILKRISEIEKSLFNDKVVFLNELGGIYHFNDTELKYQNFAIIWKENSNLFLKSSIDQPISSCSLFNNSPITIDQGNNNNSILGELILQYSSNNNQSSTTSTTDNILSWFKIYLKLLIEPNLILFTKYGISLESHLQNSVFIYQNGEPKLLILKDWSGIRIKIERLKKQLLTNHDDNKLIESIPNEIISNDLEFYKMFSHSIIHNHIAQIIIQISKEFSNLIIESQLWEITNNIFKSTFNLIKNSTSGGICDKNNINEDESFFFNSKQLKCKSLTGMRILTKNKILLPFNVNNPLYKFNN